MDVDTTVVKRTAAGTRTEGRADRVQVDVPCLKLAISGTRTRKPKNKSNQKRRYLSISPGWGSTSYCSPSTPLTADDELTVDNHTASSVFALVRAFDGSAATHKLLQRFNCIHPLPLAYRLYLDSPREYPL